MQHNLSWRPLTQGDLPEVDRIADFEQVEMVEPRKPLDQAGAETRIVSPEDKHVRAWNLTNWGER